MRIVWLRHDTPGGWCCEPNHTRRPKHLDFIVDDGGKTIDAGYATAELIEDGGYERVERLLLERRGHGTVRPDAG